MLKKTRSACLVSLLLLLLGGTGFAQDPGFTQFYANPLYLNPALAGAHRCPRVILNYRNQWPGISANFVTYSASYDQHVNALNGGIGAQVYNDRAGEGTLNTTNASLFYSYNLPLGQKFAVRAGFQATYFQKSIDWSKLTFGDMIDPRFGFIYDTQEVPGTDAVDNIDFSTGFLGYSEYFYFGVAVHHLTEPNESFFTSVDTDLPRRITLHTGAVIPFNKRYPKEGSISPNILYQRQGEFEQINFGAYLNKGPIVGGLWYRWDDSFIVLAGVQIEGFRFGYSYDLTTSELTNETGGSHEISVSFLFPCKPPRRRFKTLNCPKF